MTSIESKYRGTKEYGLIYSELITAAKYRGRITYQEIAKLLGWPLQGNWMGKEIGRLLGEISEDEVSQGRAMLSVVAVSTAGTPGPGFFNLAREFRRLESADKEAELTFLKREQQAVYDAWKVNLGHKDEGLLGSAQVENSTR